MIKKNTLTPLILAGIFVFMLGLSFAAVPLYDLFCRVTGFGGTTQISKEAPNIVLDKKINVRLDTNVNSALDWNFDVDQKTMDVQPGKVYRIKFEVENTGDEISSAVATYNVSPSSFGAYFNKLGCFCFEKQTLDLFHCEINTNEDYYRYKNAFHEWKPKHSNYKFTIPNKKIDKTIRKINLFCQK